MAPCPGAVAALAGAAPSTAVVAGGVDRPLPARATGVIALLAPALLAGLVISDVLGPDWSSADGSLALGVIIAAATRIAGAPTPACVIAAIIVTALARAAL